MTKKLRKALRRKGIKVQTTKQRAASLRNLKKARAALRKKGRKRRKSKR